MDTFDWTSLSHGPATPSLWSLNTGLTPAPLQAGGQHGMEVNPFEQSYGAAPPSKRALSPIDDDFASKRPRMVGTDSTHAHSSGVSSTSGTTPSNGETPPTAPHSPHAAKSNPMSARAAKVINANAYSNALAQYIQAHEAQTGKADGSTVIAADGGVLARSHSSGSSQRSTSQPPKPAAPTLPVLPPASLVATFAPTTTVASLPPPAIAPQPRKKAKSKSAPKPARKAAVKKQTEDVSIAGGGEHADDLDPEEAKRLDFLERNRQAATRSRQKRKAWLNGLEDEATRLTAANGELQVLISQLRSEVGSLRAIVVGHANNGCAGARLALQAARPADLPADALFVTHAAPIAMHSRALSIGGAGDIVIGGGGSGGTDPYAASALPSPQRRGRANSAPATSTPSGEKMANATSYFDLPAASSEIDFAAYLT